MSHSSGSVGPCLDCPQDLAVLGGGVLPCHTALGQWGRVWTVHRTWLCWRRCVAVSHSSGSVEQCLDCPQDLAVLEEVCCRVTQLWVSGAVSGLSTGPGCAGGGVLPCHTALGQWGRVWTVHRTWLCWRRCVAVSHSSGSVGPCLDCPQDLAVLEEVLRMVLEIINSCLTAQLPHTTPTWSTRCSTSAACLSHTGHTRTSRTSHTTSTR